MHSLKKGIFPNHLKQAYVTPVYKKGDPDDPNNYRPISVTAALSKILKKYIGDQILNYLNENRVLSPIQFGFRPKYSTTDALLFATESIRKNIDQNKYVAAAFLDLSKAFDSIPHESLMKRIKGYKF